MHGTHMQSILKAGCRQMQQSGVSSEIIIIWTATIVDQAIASSTYIISIKVRCNRSLYVDSVRRHSRWWCPFFITDSCYKSRWLNPSFYRLIQLNWSALLPLKIKFKDKLSEKEFYHANNFNYQHFAQNNLLSSGQLWIRNGKYEVIKWSFLKRCWCKFST